MITTMTEILMTKLWSQEFMGFAAVIATLLTFIYQNKKNIESRNTQNNIQKIELWIKYHSEVNSIINLIDSQWNELVLFDEDVKKICLTPIHNLKGKKKDNILNSTNNIIRLTLRVFSLKKQFSSLYEDIDKEIKVMNTLDQKWINDVETYFYFYFDKTKRPLFTSAFEKSKDLDNLPKDFSDYVDSIIEENEKLNKVSKAG
jgi:hypothetical protein